MPSAIHNEDTQQLSLGRLGDLCRVVNTYPQLPLTAVKGILQHGQVSDEEFNMKALPDWRDRLERLAAKLNAAAKVVVLQKPNTNPVLAPMDGVINLALAEGNLLAYLWLLIEVFFSEGPEAAVYFSAALEGMATSTAQGMTTVRRLGIPAPPSFWKEHDWHNPRGAMALLLALVSPNEQMMHVFTALSCYLGVIDPNVATMEKEPSVSLQVIYYKARVKSVRLGTTTFIAVNLIDKGLKRLVEEDPDSAWRFLSFRRMFLVGVCRKGAKIWQAGGKGIKDDLREHNERQGPQLMRDGEVQQFMLDFDRLAENGRVNFQYPRKHSIC